MKSRESIFIDKDSSMPMTPQPAHKSKTFLNLPLVLKKETLSLTRRIESSLK